MKYIDKIIDDIPKLDIEKEDSQYKDRLKYLADTKVILDNLRDYEVDIPKKYEDNVLGYMKELTNYKDFKGGNTYNYNGKILHDINYNYCETENGFNIADLQTEQLIAEEDYQTFSELVNRIVGRAIDYFRDEQEWENDDDAINYGLELYNIAVKYKDGTKWEESWLEDFKNELENF